MKRKPCAAWLVGLLIPGLGMMACGGDVPFSPEAESTEVETPEVETTDPVDPGILTLVTTALDAGSEAPLAGVSIHGNYAYVGGMSTGYVTTANIGVRIVDVSDPTNPTLAGRIPLREQGQSDDHSHGDAVATSLATAAFEGDVAIVLFGVSDDNTDPEPYGIWDVTDPSDPTLLSVLNLGGGPTALGHHEGGELGDKPYDAKAVVGNYFYALYNNVPHRDPRDYRLAVADISDPGNPVVVGDWQDNSEVWLIGLSVNQGATRAYITGLWPPPYGGQSTDGYLYILDIQNPSQPTELGRYVFPVLGVPSSVSIARPTSDDALVVLADHSWESTKCGILHILDTSNPAAISEVSSFALRESTSQGCADFIATDVAIRGNMVYSTWLAAGVRAIDISDPANPVEVGRFLDGGNFSDIDLVGVRRTAGFQPSWRAKKAEASAAAPVMSAKVLRWAEMKSLRCGVVSRSRWRSSK